MSKKLNYNNNSANINQILLVAFVVLIIAHGAYNTLVPNLLINLVTLVIIVFFIFLKYTNKNRIYETIIVLYFCSHFSILNKWGGLFVLTTFLIFSFYSIKGIKIPNNDKPVNLLVFIFIIMNVFGWLFKNKMPNGILILGIVTLFAYIMIFYITKNILIDKKQINILLNVIIFLLFYQLIISINTYFAVIKTDLTHLLPTPENRFGQNYMTGTFAHSEIFGEYSLLMFLFLLPFSFSNSCVSSFGIKRRTLLIGLVIAAINVALSASRSAFGLLFLGVVVFFFLTGFNLKIKIKNIFIYGTVFLAIIFSLWKPLKLNFVVQRFIDPKRGAPIISDEGFDLITGEGTAREGAFAYFWVRFPEEKWWIGYGWGIPESNRIAWFKDPDIRRSDYHSLYLSIIILYGYIGSLAYVFLIILTTRRMFKVLKTKKADYHLKIAASAFFLLLLFLIINQYKVSLLRMPHYHLITWLWLGFSNAIYYTFKKRNYEISLAGSLPNN